MLTPEGLLGLARQPAPFSSRSRKKPPSLHGTESGQPRDSDGLREPEPPIKPDIAAVLWLASSQSLSVVPQPPNAFSSVSKVNLWRQHN